MLRLCRHSISAGDLANLDAMIRSIVIDYQFLQRETNARLNFGAVGSTFTKNRLLDQFDQLIERHRRFRRVDNGFKFSFKAHGLLTLATALISSHRARRPARPRLLRILHVCAVEFLRTSGLAAVGSPANAPFRAAPGTYKPAPAAIQHCATSASIGSAGLPVTVAAAGIQPSGRP